MRRLQITIAAVLGAIALGALAMPAKPAVRLEPVYVEGGQYTARLYQSSRSWRLMPIDGQDLVISNPDIYCRSDAAAPSGVWLVGRDPAGGLELRAPSATALANGQPDHLAMLPCGQPAVAGAALHAPQALLDWIGGHNGAVYIGD